jgi:drug/metabolite transporter (DMT)-like permease
VALIAEIMDAPEFAEIMFLVGFILFIIEVVRLIAVHAGDRSTTWGYHWLLVVAGLACLALGFLASDNGADEDDPSAASAVVST